VILLVLFSCTNYLNRTIDKEYYSNGKLKYKVEKLNNKLDGITLFWDSRGNLINKVEYSNGKIHGKWIEYFKSGNIKSVTNYKYDKKDGIETYYYNNGKKKIEKIYNNGIELKDIKRWKNNGEKIQ